MSNRAELDSGISPEQRTPEELFQDVVSAKTKDRVSDIRDGPTIESFLEKVRVMLLGPKVRGADPLEEPQDYVRDDRRVDEPVTELAPGLAPLERIVKLLVKHNGPIVAVVEESHVDSVYRNMIYSWYSRRVTNVPRFTLRISFFRNNLTNSSTIDSDYLRVVSEGGRNPKALEEVFLGATVVYPIEGALLGRTLIAPENIVSEDAHMRLANYQLKIFGTELSVDAFPFRVQDAETISCAETTLLNLMEYYSARYPNYSMVMPSDLTELEAETSSDRTVPAKGINYTRLSQILGKIGFYPRLDSLTTLKRGSLSMPGEDQFRRHLLWYVGSGIPAAVNIVPSRRERDSHSLAVIGFTDTPQPVIDAVKDYFSGESGVATPASCFKDEIDVTLRRMERSSVVLLQKKDPDGNLRSCLLLQEADFPRSLVTIDDCEIPYAICPYENLSPSQSMRCENIAVPLHKGMAIDAQDAYDIFRTVLEDENLGLLAWGGNCIHDDGPIVMRMFLMTAGSYKGFRTNTSPKSLRAFYETQVLPHFVWVAELVFLSEYTQDSKEAVSFAEVVLDATVCRKTSLEDKLLVMRYPGKFAWREPSDPEIPFGIHLVEWTQANGDPSTDDRFRSCPFALNTVTPAINQSCMLKGNC